MVKIGKMFTRKGGEEGSAYSKTFSIKNKFRKPSPTLNGIVADLNKHANPTSPPGTGNHEADESRTDSPVEFPDGDDVQDEMRDEETSIDDEQTYDASVQSSAGEEGSDAYGEEGTVNTYEEDQSYVTNVDDEQTYTSAVEEEKVATNESFNTMKGDLTSKKYFHKDVVLNSLEEGTNSLVIRAMYFIPKPKEEDHIVVKIEASTISAKDCMKCRGHNLKQADLPFVPGYDVVGTVQALGNKSKKSLFSEGDRVAGIAPSGGGNSRFISIPASRLTKIPSTVKSTLAVCMLQDYMAALKALRMAKKNGSPFTAMNLLVTDGYSPVGQAIIKLASREGANVYCCADAPKHAYLATLGVKCFPRNPEEWLPNAKGTFDVVIDNSCIDSYTSSWQALTKKGSLVCVAPVYNLEGTDASGAMCGVVDMAELKKNFAQLKAKYVMSQTSFLDMDTCYEDDVEQYKQDLRYLMFLLEKGDVTPKVAERVSLDDVPDAQRLMQSGRANGTVVCVPWIEG